jgi:hypothetical protein
MTGWSNGQRSCLDRATRTRCSEREVVAPQAIYCADQAKAPVAIPQLASVPVPAAVEELLETNQALVSAADFFG